ncbi:MAG: peptidoglycan DD-metalloendopeptidase family protein [Magnetococcales bacterium]|nr:peptidoglycan DD-metalloendopeptidase family protein [Magnetococcales bacterium]
MSADPLRDRPGREPAPIRIADGPPLAWAVPATPAQRIDRSTSGSYSVQAGDTLWAIAAVHGLDVEKLAAWNKIDDPDLLFLGQKLAVKPPPGQEEGAPRRSSRKWRERAGGAASADAAAAKSGGVTEKEGATPEGGIAVPPVKNVPVVVEKSDLTPPTPPATEPTPPVVAATAKAGAMSPGGSQPDATKPAAATARAAAAATRQRAVSATATGQGGSATATGAVTSATPIDGQGTTTAAVTAVAAPVAAAAAVAGVAGGATTPTAKGQGAASVRGKERQATPSGPVEVQAKVKGKGREKGADAARAEEGTPAAETTPPVAREKKAAVGKGQGEGGGSRESAVTPAKGAASAEGAKATTVPEAKPVPEAKVKPAHAAKSAAGGKEVADAKPAGEVMAKVADSKAKVVATANPKAGAEAKAPEAARAKPAPEAKARDDDDAEDAASVAGEDEAPARANVANKAAGVHKAARAAAGGTADGGGVAGAPARASTPAPVAAAAAADADDVGQEEESPGRGQPRRHLIRHLNSDGPTTRVNAPKGWLWPVDGGEVVSQFGRRRGMQNNGIDISVPVGTPVKAAASGVVAYADNSLPGYGNMIIVRHGGGYMTAYAHNSKIMVNRGQKVQAGQVIAQSGQSGRATTPRLHFELRKSIKPYNPLKYLAKN